MHTLKNGQQRLLNQGRSNATRDIGATLVLKQGGLFLLTDASGMIPAQTGEEDAGMGLYFHDMRHLDRVTLTLNDAPLTTLLATSDLGHQGAWELTNPDIALGADQTLRKQTIGLRWERRLDAVVHESLAFHNFSGEAAALTFTLTYDAHFDDMFTVRGAEPGKRGTVHRPTHTDDSLAFTYDGADGHHRTTTLTFGPNPDAFDGHVVTYHLHLAPHEMRTYTVTIAVADQGPQDVRPLETQPRPVTNGRHEAHVHADQGSVSGKVFVETSNALFNRVLRRSFLDLAMLATQQGDDHFFAAGVPWYVALFGRDSLITALEMLAYEPNIARNTLEILARYQGTKEDAYRDEEPGKILHELRVGEKANLHEVPSTPYYGTVDATPLWLILLGEYVRWTGDLDFFKGMHDHVTAAIAWMDTYGDRDGDGFVEYASESSKGLSNQGWKDSGNSIVNADGSIVTPPVALVEVQGYAYRARRVIADVYRRVGDETRATKLTAATASLRTQFNARFWLPDRQNYAQALQKDGRPAAVDASNQGQALWGGIVDVGNAPSVRDTLLDPARLFSGWGIRTLSAQAVAYNPFDYQVGAVWPHDNALILGGLRRYGFDADALRVFTGIYEAATQFDHFRLPELFAGFSKDEFGKPVRYPVACSPQAWAAGSLPAMLLAMLGLEPDAFAHRLTIVHPCLPEWLAWVTIQGVKVGPGVVDLRYQRHGTVTLVAVTKKTGDLDVSVSY